jgi:hypothetical protein
MLLRFKAACHIAAAVQMRLMKFDLLFVAPNVYLDRDYGLVRYTEGGTPTEFLKTVAGSTRNVGPVVSPGHRHNTPIVPVWFREIPLMQRDGWRVESGGVKVGFVT